jgi:DNA-directed RNA polymerase beta subunit
LITSVNLCGTPYQSNTDSTRLQMVSKQIQQTLTHINCDIPYVIDQNYDKISKYSKTALQFAKDNGSVLFKNNEIIVINYDHKGLEIHETPTIKKTHGVYASRLRNIMDQNTKFKKGDIIFEYDCFSNGIPSWGYNTFTAYDNWFAYNHEDSLVISESFAEKAKVTMTEKIVLPIYEFTILDPIYNNSDDFVYFPNIGRTLNKNILCQSFIPKTRTDEIFNITNIKNQVVKMLKSMSLSDYIKMNQKETEISQFKKEVIKTKIENAKISGIKIHKLKPGVKLLDKKLNNVLESMFNTYGNFIIDTYNDLNGIFDESFSKEILKKHYVYQYDSKRQSKSNLENTINLKECVYILEFEIIREDSSSLGDKFSNRYAGKGVCSLILPDELRPIAMESNEPIDIVFNPFSVYSRMNLGQILDGSIAKTVKYCDQHIRHDPDSVKEVITWLNDNIIYHLSEDKDYHTSVRKEIVDQLDDSVFKEKFINNIKNQHLFIEGPSFSHINLKKLNENLIDTNESMLIKKETIKYVKEKMKLKSDFVITGDIVRKNIYCVPMYINKLFKLTKNIVNARDFGQVKDVTQQPVRGRARGGGSRLGQMEIEGLLSSGCELAVKELLTVKSDRNEEKRKLVKEIIEQGEFNMTLDTDSTGGQTKKVVSAILNFLKE